ncbi:hypothetical protein BY996DRAFT_4645734 [Phakopsora pachyrhizi]|nr:hypothetical protein BY996DRAFT_4645734 [Phakopsora pachyrhizi]
MEKFSTWRDPSTGLAPFVYPLAPLASNLLPDWLKLPLYPIALMRTIILIILAVSLVVINLSIENLFPFLSTSSRRLIGKIFAKVLGRSALYVLGFISLPCDVPFTIKSPTFKVLGQRDVGPGEIIMTNWSSYVELIYLTYLYDPIFLVPVPDKESNEVKGFTQESMIKLIISCGNSPTVFDDPSRKNVKSLSHWIKGSKDLFKRPIVILPEATTSNNRALLKFPNLNPTSIGQIDEDLIVFFLIFRHEQPSRLRNSITIPIPSKPLNLPHVLTSNLFPITLFPPILLLIQSILSPSTSSTSSSELVSFNSRSFNVRYPKNNNFPMSIKAEDLFETGAKVMTSVGKLKQTNTIGCVHKEGFLSYLKSRRKY